MDRRDFLLLKGAPAGRSVELSGEWIYMKCLDAQVTGQRVAPEVFDGRTTKELFEELERGLRDADTVRVTKMQWLTGPLRQEFEAVLQSVRTRGGKIQIEE